MKIVYLSAFYPPHVAGGAEITLSTLVQGMRARGHEVIVLCTGPHPETTEDTVNGVRVVRVGLKNFYWNYTNKDRPEWTRALWHLRDIFNFQMASVVQLFVKAEKPDVVSCHILAGWSVSAWWAIKKEDIPVVQVLHDMYLLCARSTMYRQGANCRSKCTRCSLFRAPHSLMTSYVDCVVGISKFILDRHLAQGYFQATPKHQVIYNTRSYPLKNFTNNSLDGKRVRFGFIGTLSREKGIDWLLKIFSRLPTSLNAELWVAGEGKPNFVTELHERYASDRIRFLGRVKPEDYYPEIDMLIVPSLWEEPLGMVVPEAFTYAVPVLASRRGGLPEMIIEEKNGYLFDVEDVTELEGLISKFAQNPSLITQMRPTTHASAAPYLNTNTWCDQYESLYRDIV